jgi:hypothetical protein
MLHCCLHAYMAQPFDFYDESALLDRLSKGLKRRSQPTVFLVGAPMSAPAFVGAPGVPGVDGVLDLIRGEFADDPVQLSALNEKLESEKARRYQAAFQFLQGRRGQQAANEIVRRAVRSARSTVDGILDGSPLYSDDECSQMELDTHGWVLGPGTEHLAKLATQYPDRFGKSILTTNFDPLIEVAIRKHGGHFFQDNLALRRRLDANGWRWLPRDTPSRLLVGIRHASYIEAIRSAAPQIAGFPEFAVAK